MDANKLSYLILSYLCITRDIYIGKCTISHKSWSLDLDCVRLRLRNLSPDHDITAVS